MIFINNTEIFKRLNKALVDGFPFPEHFNSLGDSLADIAVRGLRRCSGASFRQKQLEMVIISWLGTLQPESLNYVFHFI